MAIITISNPNVFYALESDRPIPTAGYTIGDLLIFEDSGREESLGQNGWFDRSVENGSAPVIVGGGNTGVLATAVTAISVQAQVNISPNEKTVECVLTGTGAISATVLVYGAETNRNTNGTLLGTLSLSGATTAVDSILINTPWAYVWTDTTAISGTGAAHTTRVGY